jgi:Polyketide cyclase / dehydrase and lipid transport
MWMYVVGAVGVGVAGPLVFAATRPDAYQVSRSIEVQAAPERVFALTNELREMNQWNPFVKSDPGSKITYTGPASGPGAAYEFEGGKSGAGRMEIVAASAPTRVTLRLQMRKPMASESHVDFSIEPRDAGARVTWSMRGEQSYLMKLMGLVFSMDKMLGGTFESGLVDLREMAQRAPTGG